MTSTTLDILFRVEPPWIHVGPGEDERVKWNPSHFYSRSGIDVCVRRLRGQKMRSVEALMNEFGAAFQLFEGFGENWYALEDCLECLDEWLPADAYVLVIERAEEVLQEEEPSQMAALLKTLNGAGEFWSKRVEGTGRFDRDAIPFHVLMNVSAELPTAEDRITKAASGVGVATGELRTP